MATVQQWTGIEVRALRNAMRMSLREFAAHLGVSERMISKWEAAGGNVTPRPVNQAALDTCMQRSDSDTQARFKYLTDGRVVGGSSETTELIGSTQVRHPSDGSLMVKVDASVFLAGPSNEPVWVPAYYIDVHPVSNAEYARFTAATGHKPPEHWPDEQYPAELANHPVVFVTWKDAIAYAHWADKELPTAQQWEKAARGTRGMVYPWGDQPTPAKCNVRESGIGATTPVDRYQSGVSPYGAYDMCGNVWEWFSTASRPGRRELRGGAWTSPFDRATPSSFNDAAETMCDDDTGFRCAVSADAMERLLNK
ncbi:transcriptional regulator with XRE-family HTH domain [Actinopolyspora biskrensis]|uniref:Transcriptional regulator with XRE-family HTH domain n=1 Tax=Actinopolyspora biskrensis TaxID=1470178 RepID=A0A852YVV0_9ACTN|nr:SUMF1/EgtB/PvdO family nonheme iron enzyme [Actinopolyspora biskrensis]NYH79264.1 transcriptional regulator with XRE-family HTH domain [Actinopolyspora biskrensis]